MNNYIQDSDIIFLTPTFGTKWLFYQQYLLKKFFPHAKRVLIDGNIRWDFDKGLDCVWYDFIKIALDNKNNFKYFVHIDEDCFITEGSGILDAIQILETENFDLIGPADIVSKLRNENPKALNSFFMIGKISSLETVMKGYNINLTFKELNIQLNPTIKDHKIEYEPYYDFFWNYYKKGLKIANVATSFDEVYKCTGLLDNHNNTFGYHMWFTRKWRDRTEDDYLGMSMYNRYQKMGEFLRDKFNISEFELLNGLDGNNKFKYISILYSRFVLKNVFRIRREMKRILQSK